MPSQWGERYWCIKSPLSDDGEIYAYADEVDVDLEGSLRLTHRGVPTLIFPKGKWDAVYLAEEEMGSPVSISSWAGELEGE